VLPFGAAVGFLQIAVPFWLAKLGMPLDQIAALSATAFTPHAVKILWIPLIDITGRRKLWYLLAANTVAVLLAVASLVRNPLEHRALYVVLLTALQAAAATSAAALNALMATTPREEDKGRTGGFYMAGNVGGTSVLGALAIWLSARYSPTVAGLLLAGFLSLCTWGALWLHEGKESSPKSAQNLVKAALLRMLAIFKDLWALVWSREGLTGILICAAPVGCGALMNLFSAMAIPYRLTDGTVASVNGIGAGVTGALGSLLGGFLADRMNRRLCYALAGGLTALVALALTFSPMTPTVYQVGVLAYSFGNGLAFAAFAGLVLEIVNRGAVATKYALFVATSNFAINYTTALDGWASNLWNLGTRGTLGFDAAITFLGIALLGVMVAITRRLEPASPRTAT